MNKYLVLWFSGVQLLTIKSGSENDYYCGNKDK